MDDESRDLMAISPFVLTGLVLMLEPSTRIIW